MSGSASIRFRSQASVQLYNLLYHQHAVNVSELPCEVLEIFSVWSYEDLVAPVVASQLMGPNASVRSLAARYNVSEHFVYQLGKRIGKYGKRRREISQ